MKKLMKKFNNLIEAIGVDKIIHFLVGYAIVATGMIYSFGLGAAMFLAVLVLSIAKEYLFDEQVDWIDIWMSVIGGILAFIAYIPKDMMLLM